MELVWSSLTVESELKVAHITRKTNCLFTASILELVDSLETMVWYLSLSKSSQGLIYRVKLQPLRTTRDLDYYFLLVLLIVVFNMSTSYSTVSNYLKMDGQ